MIRELRSTWLDAWPAGREDWADMVRENPYAEPQARAKAFTAQRRIADPAEPVPAVLYLASDAASFVSGAVLRIDGGMISL